MKTGDEESETALEMAAYAKKTDDRCGEAATGHGGTGQVPPENARRTARRRQELNG